MFDRIAAELSRRAEASARPVGGEDKRRQAGDVVPGSSTDVAMRFFLRSPGRWFFHWELCLALGRSKGEIDWALIQLQKIGWIEAAEYQDPGRAPVNRYCYLVKKK